MASSDILLRDLSDDGILRLTLNDMKRRQRALGSDVERAWHNLL